MRYILLSLTAAMVFGLAAHAVFGTEALATLPWIDVVFASIIGAGLGMAIGEPIFCRICRRAKQRRAGLARICGGVLPCAHA